MVAMADQNERAAFAREFQRFQMNFGHQRAGRVNHAQLAFLRFGAHSRRNAVRAENQHRADRHFLDRLDKNRAAAAQLIHHVAVVHDFVVHVDRAAVSLQRQLDDIHRAHHSRAKSSRPHAHERLRPGSFPGC